MLCVALSACDYTQSEIKKVLTCWQTIQVSPASSEWLKDNVSMNFSTDTIPSSYVWSASRTLEWLSQVLESHIQLNAIVTFCCERHLRVSHVFSCLFRQLYINQCKFHIISSSHSTCTACTTMYYRFFNIWNKLLKCTYIHLSLFHSNISNIQHFVHTWCLRLLRRQHHRQSLTLYQWWHKHKCRE